MFQMHEMPKTNTDHLSMVERTIALVLCIALTTAHYSMQRQTLPHRIIYNTHL